MEISLALSCLALALVILNSLTIRVVRNHHNEIAESVSILIPMRNEEKNVANCVTSLISQTGLKDFEILVLDDCSTDQTMKELSRFSDIKF